MSPLPRKMARRPPVSQPGSHVSRTSARAGASNRSFVATPARSSLRSSAGAGRAGRMARAKARRVHPQAWVAAGCGTLGCRRMAPLTVERHELSREDRMRRRRRRVRGGVLVRILLGLTLAETAWLLYPTARARLLAV